MQPPVVAKLALPTEKIEQLQRDASNLLRQHNASLVLEVVEEVVDHLITKVELLDTHGILTESTEELERIRLRNEELVVDASEAADKLQYVPVPCLPVAP